MSLALGMGSTIRDCAYQGWYDEAKIRSAWYPPTDFQKWTRDEWAELAKGIGVSNLYTAISEAIDGQTSFMDPNAPVNTYRLKGNGDITAISLHQ
jgi:hypothetical protein